MAEDKKPDNPNAFPFDKKNSYTGAIQQQHLGMTLRDYFAAKAMQALLSNSSVKLSVGPETPNDNDRLAKISYTIADAMLKQREL